MISFELSEEQKILRESARDFAASLAPKIPELDAKQEFDPTVLPKMGEMGLLGVSIPTKYGGSGMDYISTAIVSEEMEYVDAALRVIISVHNGLNSLSIYQWGTEEQKEKYLVPQAEGKRIATFGLTEPNAGSDVVAMESSAKEDGDYYILNGSKMWISLADVADNFLVFAKTQQNVGHKGVTAFLIEREMKGLSSGTIHDKLGVRSGNTGYLNFDDIAVPKENILGQVGEGFKIAMSSLDNGRYTVAAGALGCAKASRDASVKYAHERKTFGKEIGEHQLVQRLLANMQQGIDASELLIWKAGWMKNMGIRNTRETAMAKWMATNVAFQSADDAIQIHGAYGFAGGPDGYPVERFMRNARGARIYEGSDQIQEIMQGSYVMGYRVDKPLRKELPKWEPEE
ncbi:MAG: acyl-CoA dehydrogenase family protein [Candidatus Heimdallarchaeota archaeon]|nr:acyl-CoA dehydrogenase family protein [Candidatus Heimdallarchaeota archaeon]